VIPIYWFMSASKLPAFPLRLPGRFPLTFCQETAPSQIRIQKLFVSCWGIVGHRAAPPEGRDAAVFLRGSGNGVFRNVETCLPAARKAYLATTDSSRRLRTAARDLVQAPRLRAPGPSSGEVVAGRSATRAGRSGQGKARRRTPSGFRVPRDHSAREDVVFGAHGPHTAGRGRSRLRKLSRPRFDIEGR